MNINIIQPSHARFLLNIDNTIVGDNIYKSYNLENNLYSLYYSQSPKSIFFDYSRIDKECIQFIYEFNKQVQCYIYYDHVGSDFIKFGLGFDVHRLVPNKNLYLGGIKIPSTLGTLGHSDGDPVLHAVTDSVLGACSMGDIGEKFSDKNRKFKINADMMNLLGCSKENFYKLMTYMNYKKDKVVDTYVFKGERKKKGKLIKFDKKENPFNKLLSLNIK